MEINVSPSARKKTSKTARPCPPPVPPLRRWCRHSAGSLPVSERTPQAISAQCHRGWMRSGRTWRLSLRKSSSGTRSSGNRADGESGRRQYRICRADSAAHESGVVREEPLLRAVCIRGSACAIISNVALIVTTPPFLSPRLSAQRARVEKFCVAVWKRGARRPWGTSSITSLKTCWEEKRPLKSRLSPATEREELFDAFVSVCQWVQVFFLWRPNLPDEGDNHVVELAIACSAQAIVTHNTRDFGYGELRFPGLEVLTPAQFLRKTR